MPYSDPNTAQSYPHLPLRVSEPTDRHSPTGSIMVFDAANNDVAEFLHYDQATVGQTYEQALALANAFAASASPAQPQDAAPALGEDVREAFENAVTFLEHDTEWDAPGTDLYTWRKGLAEPLMARLRSPAQVAPVDGGGITIERYGKERKGASVIFAQSEYDSEAHRYEEPLPGMVVALDVDGSILSIDIENLSANMAPADGGGEPTLADACKPWEFHVGEPPDDDSPLLGVYDAGLTYAFELLAKALGAETYQLCDGTETWEGDVAGTLHNILVAGGIICDETGARATLPATTPASAGDGDLRAALVEARQWVEANTANVRGLSAEAAAPGEAMLKRIDAALARPRTPAGAAGDPAEEELRSIVSRFDVHAYAERYDFRDPDHTPTDDERALLEDFGEGIIGEILTARPAPQAPAASPGGAIALKRLLDVSTVVYGRLYEAWLPTHSEIVALCDAINEMNAALAPTAKPEPAGREEIARNRWLDWRGAVEGIDASISAATKGVARGRDRLSNEGVARDVCWLLGLDHVWQHVEALRAAVAAKEAPSVAEVLRNEADRLHAKADAILAARPVAEGVAGWLQERIVAAERDRDAHLEGSINAAFYDAQITAYENALSFVSRPASPATAPATPSEGEQV